MAGGLVLGPVSGPALARSDEDATQRMIDAAVSAVRPSLVRIHVVSAEDQEGREVKEEAFGSGAIISENGYVITNHHVAGHATQITCTLADKTEVDAKLVGTDALADIAVIQLTPAEKRTFPVAKFGDSSKLSVGDRVLAMGSPLALSQSVTMGIVSNTEMIAPPVMGPGALTMDGEDVGSIVRWIGHDAEIHPGNSGGPLVNIKGQIVGINEIQLGLGGAIPGNLAKDIADQLIRNGKVRRAWLGVTTQPLLKSSSEKKGVLIDNTLPGSPAEKAGFKPGDILIRMAGQDVTVRFAEEKPIFNQYCMSLPIGKEAEAVVLRGGKEVTLKITPVERPDAKAKPEELKEWGITASNLTALAATEKKRDKTLGALVTSVRAGGPSGDAKPELADGDVIVSVNGQDVAGMDDLRKITKSTTDGKTEPTPTLVTFERNGSQFVTVVKLGVQEIKDGGLEVAKAWLPVASQVLTQEIATAMGLQDRTGVRITQVYHNTTAEKAGLKVGDVIVAMDGNPVQASQPEDVDVFPAMVRQYKIGSTSDLTVIRGGKEMKITAELPQSPKLPREMPKYQDDNFDLVARDITFFDKVDEQWPDSQTGIVVDSVGQGGWASLGGLSVGDLIIAMDGNPVHGITDFQQMMDAIKNTKPKTVVFQVKNGVREKYVELQPAWPAH